MSSATVLALPFTGRWSVRNSPTRRVPSHGTENLADRYAIDFIGVDEQHQSARAWDWRSVLATEPPERFLSHGRPVLAPLDGVVMAVHDGEDDHEAHRSLLTRVPYAWGRASREARGVSAMAGNYAVIAYPDMSAHILLAQLRRGSLRVEAGDQVGAGQQIAECGSSGNAQQPHVHLQAMDGPDPVHAQGLPVAFADFREWVHGVDPPYFVETGLPGEDSVVEPLPRS
ncbi:M23 family metallopeptidase [Nocardiopsis xinjiangensis]|uniref:M23 family metallopeptidase n=1 Tax=Nocardiopsis xinjiangensis TaxID=124285 RepID=UPI0003499BC0|nr:M23 family metallopeptidase [Nocardiopsis xinjiangensis]